MAIEMYRCQAAAAGLGGGSSSSLRLVMCVQVLTDERPPDGAGEAF